MENPDIFLREILFEEMDTIRLYRCLGEHGHWDGAGDGWGGERG